MSRIRTGCRLSFLLALSFSLFLPSQSSGADPEEPIVLTQLPLARAEAQAGTPADGVLEGGCGDGARILLVAPGAGPRILTEGFHSACDPDVSFDGRHLLFAGKREAGNPWNIFEMELDGRALRQVTDDAGDCRHPIYLGTFYTIDSAEPWRRIAFVSSRAGEANEFGGRPSTSLYVTRMDGSATSRLTFNPSSDTDPTILPDGRLLFSSWRRSTLERGAFGRVGLFTSQTDGLDHAVFSMAEGGRIKRMPCVTTDRLVVFVESDEASWDGAGTLAAVSLRRNLHSYRSVTARSDGLFHSPSPLPGGKILVSRRTTEPGSSHGVHRLDPRTGGSEPLFDDPEYHDIQARRIGARPQPDGRSSVLSEEHATGKLYCLDVHESDLPEGSWIRPGDAPRLRVLEGVPLPAGEAGAVPPLLPRRVLGEVPIEEDGSFHIEVPANLPLELQLLGADGTALRSCSWIWVRNKETRGCIGCHEDGERTPKNRFVEALGKPSVPLVPPPGERRSVDFRRDVMPVLSAKCAAASCHSSPSVPPVIGGGADRTYRSLLEPGYVKPGSARNSPLIWHTLGRIRARPWDEVPAPDSFTEMPLPWAEPLTDDEIRTLLEWIDLGAASPGSGGAR